MQPEFIENLPFLIKEEWKRLGFIDKGSIMKVDAAQNVQGAVMVVGGGIAGMQAALDLADSGFYVHLVEKSPAIGGVMSQLDKTFPTNDCAM